MHKKLDLSENAPWKQRFRALAVINSEISKNDPTTGVAVSNKDGKYQIYKWDVENNTLTQLTDTEDGQYHYYLSPDGKYIYYLQDEKGNYMGHYVRVPLNGGEPEDITPDMPLYSSWEIDINANNTHLGFTAENEGETAQYICDISSDEKISAPRQIHQSKGSGGPFLSHDGEVTIILTTEKSGTNDCSLLAFDTATDEQIAELWDGENTSISTRTLPHYIHFSPISGDTRLVGSSNRTGNEMPFIWDPCTGERSDLKLDGVTGSIVVCDWSPDGKYLLLREFSKAVQQFYSYNIENKTLTKLNHPAGTIENPYFTQNGEIYGHLSDAATPERLVALDGKTGELKRTVLEAGVVPPGREWRSFTTTSSDGQEIQGWVATPEGEGPFPTIFDIIGGPGLVQSNMFHPNSQSWLDHGFAFASINYRGSTTFGRDFQQKVIGDLGNWEVEDMVAARNWLVEEGIAIPEAIFLTGWSYGGYLTLQAIGKYPDLWRGGMAVIAIVDWTVMYEDSELSRGGVVAFLGGTPDEKPEVYKKSSPISYAENVTAPVLIIQGKNDTMIPSRATEMYEEKMKSLGKDIEVAWFDSGHSGSFSDIELGIQHQKRMMQFVDKISS